MSREEGGGMMSGQPDLGDIHMHPLRAVPYQVMIHRPPMALQFQSPGRRHKDNDKIILYLGVKDRGRNREGNKGQPFLGQKEGTGLLLGMKVR